MNRLEMKHAIVKKTREVIIQAENRYGVELQATDIRFDLHGRSAGMACQRGRHLHVRFNMEAAEKDWDHLFNDTIPHEVAHLVGYRDPTFAWNHNKAWVKTCKELGGTGKRTHNMDLTPRSKMKYYQYKLPCGYEVKLSATRHKRCQNGSQKYHVTTAEGDVKYISSLYFVG